MRRPDAPRAPRPRRWLLWAVAAALLVAAAAAAAQPVQPPRVDPEQVNPTGTPPERLQEALKLRHLTPGALPHDGLVTLGLGGSTGSALFPLDGGAITDVTTRDLRAWLAWGLRPWAHVRAEGRMVGIEQGELPGVAGGSALGDTRLEAFLGLPVPGRTLSLALHGGVVLPTGDVERGTSEDASSRWAGAAATVALFRRSQLPELRLHLNVGRRWNRNEALGYGWDAGANFQPWPPHYPAAAAAGGDRENDYTLLGAALEFRQNEASLWLEYYEYRLDIPGVVSAREDPAFLTAGVRWGRSEGIALHAGYEVSLAVDDPATPFWPGYADLRYHVGLSYQLPLGGRDRDGDGIPDRRDACPDSPEDLDGFQDDDGCPDLDNDLDGVPDLRDAAPLEPEDYDGWQDEDGAPDLDNDGDGIPDALDLCPDQPEDFDGVEDDDGCPEEHGDRDGDGVPDRYDLCPDQPEDHDGFEDHDGCPDPDNDLDGIPDDRDECPDEAEDYDGDADGDGCPE
ncbi:MAG: thrombospondin type 3 repeat-containing protein [Candidatus Krumholzibacteriia bacterium]